MRDTKHRFKIWNNNQHPYKHTLGDFGYFHPSLPGVSNLEGALNWMLAVLYPNAKATVNTPADLPLVGNTINDYRVVKDDGDGKSASYRWEQREGEAVASWHKVYDIDWGQDAILTDFLGKTQDIYAVRNGFMDKDLLGNVITGIFSGQRIYGGTEANSNLTFSANSGDGTGPNTGFIQFTDQIRPTTDGEINLGRLTERFLNLYLKNAISVGDMVISSGLITDLSGSISLGSNRLYNVSKIEAGEILIDADVAISEGVITSTSGKINFGANDFENIKIISFLKGILGNTVIEEGKLSSTSGEFSFETNSLKNITTIFATSAELQSAKIGSIYFANNEIYPFTNNTDLHLRANGIGKVYFASDVEITAKNLDLTGGNITCVGTVKGNRFEVDKLILDNNALVSNDGNILLSPFNSILSVDGSILPVSSTNLGSATQLWNTLFLSGKLGDGTNEFTVSDLFSLKDIKYRDAGRTIPAQTGDSLFYDSTSGLWLASRPDLEITHADLTGIADGDAGHTQFVMLGGRSGGQTVYGGITSLENLTLRSNVNDNGRIFFGNTLEPITGASWSGTVWSGLDIGSSTNKIRNVYSEGEFFGLRFESVTGLPASSASRKGRAVWHSTEKKLYVDEGGTGFKIVGGNKYDIEHTFDGVTKIYDIDVSSTIQDATSAIRQLAQKNGTQYQNVFCDIIAMNTTTVRISANPALPAGVYRLTLLE